LPDFKKWIQSETNPQIASILAADTQVVLAQRQLPETFHADPAGRLIAATSILSGYPLATHDRRIREANVCEIWEG